MALIEISKQFSKYPGFRFREDGQFSGQEFREDHLEAHFKDQNDNEVLLIDLDGVFGYATSFLEEAFGGLARKFGIERVTSKLKFISNDEPLLIAEINSYIRNCNG